VPFAYIHKEIPDGVAGTYATVREIVGLIQSGTRNERVRLAAIEAIRNCPWKNRKCEAEAIFAWLRRNIRFTYDPEGAELLQDVDAIMMHRAADCDDFVILGGAMLRSVGIPARIVIIASDPSAPSAFSHIYLHAELRPGDWVGFDPTVTDSRLGWEPPRFTRKEVIAVED
jgi:predicted transglutaminase-like cysteine proteinase